MGLDGNWVMSERKIEMISSEKESGKENRQFLSFYTMLY